jgi:hypothetical protein
MRQSDMIGIHISTEQSRDFAKERTIADIRSYV